MSTTFGFRIKKEGEDDELMVIAFRSGVGKGRIEVHWKWPYNETLFPDDTMKVEALDNTAQGIETIGDIKKAIKQNGQL